VTLQDLIFKLSDYWAAQGCLIQQPLDTEMGAGTMHPETFLRVLGPQPWNVAYVQPSRRPADGRFGENPNRLFKHHQFQVILKPAPDDVQDLYLQSLEACGIDLRSHDVRFEEDNWESPTLGAWGIGWQVLYDGLEITQFTYFQQAGGIDLSPISVELTYGLERFAMALQGVDNVYDLQWAPGVKYRDVRLRDEIEQSKYAFARGLDPVRFAEFHRDMFTRHYDFARELLEAGLVLPALDYCLKCSHFFNLLDASGSIGVTERTAYILRVRQLAVAIAGAWVGPREAEGVSHGS
jgi:glycyl-tRNA synthetase alpha chain